MPSSAIVQTRDAAGQQYVKRRRAEGADPVAAPTTATAEPTAPRAGTPPAVGRRESTPEKTPVAATATSLDDIDDPDADDENAIITGLDHNDKKRPRPAPQGGSNDNDEDSDDEELLRLELERARAKAASAAEARRAAPAGGVAKRYDADVLFRYDTNAGKAADSKLPKNDPTANEFHARFLKRFFK
jgi:hypothetical protein